MFNKPKAKLVRPLTFHLSGNGRIPNSHLPVLLYRGAAHGEDLEPFFQREFARNHWGGQWAQGIYGYHHFHSNAHEALGIVAGSATLVIGGEGGRELDVSRGDVLVLPAGTATDESETVGISGLLGRIHLARRISTNMLTGRCAPTAV